MFSSLLIANRGEIARRIIRTARRMGLRTIALATEADRTWPHWREADEAVFIGEGPAADSYLSIEKILRAAAETGAEAIHPGYGFLSENARFAEACREAGLVFVGPPAAAIRAMGSKAEAKALMQRAGVPVVPGYHGERQDADFLREKAYETGYPVLIKAISGGGGRGMRLVGKAKDFDAALASARREAESAFGDPRVLVERYVTAPRHIEMQVFADRHGNVVHLFERDCSVQRRHQKVLEEAPAPGMSPELRAAMGEAAVKAAAAVGYEGAGTVEFIADGAGGLKPDGFFFMEMNTRLQVEHPVTEEVTGLDLVEWQLRVAAGEKLPMAQEEIPLSGHAIEARLYAEDPSAGFAPGTGAIVAADFPAGEGIRVDSGVEKGTFISPFYDSMVAKVIATGPTRAAALARLTGALADTRLAGPRTNQGFLLQILRTPEFAAGGVDTGFVEEKGDALTARPDLAPLAWDLVAEEVMRRAPPGDPVSPWSRSDAFEISGLERRLSVHCAIDGVGRDVPLVWRSGRPVSPDGAQSEEIDGLGSIEAGGAVYLLKDGHQAVLSFPDPLDRSLAEVAGENVVLAPMHGRIARLAVEEGAAVEAGDLLFTLEAMKMEHSVTAPAAGRVAGLLAREGDQVEEQAEIMRIEPAREGEPSDSGNAVASEPF
ncbi:biotin carboxylase N-terminal domain-containing protein [Afifella sp. IM 167]|uniref:acetyl/propionyl/methylcrotonyl-CoA carboxylase subunit alpha n=1 Tax=Afifella sp. IM 167 TaxID=2033586 RepID=UPI001CC9E739|nr:biotin carboxylase N-terminal domain-containing protein [Afifella sp. IM 167]MBZ8132352.1 carbamoyl-phosphate synthase subunit L [Afifella sp. IM 167]